MNTRMKMALALCCVAATVLAASGVAVATGTAIPIVNAPDSPAPAAQEVASTSRNVIDAFAAFRSPVQSGDAKGQQALRDAFGRSESGRLAANADFSAARRAPIAGSTSNAWIAPSGDNVCVFLPDPADGFAVTCASIAAVKAGRGVLLLSPRAGSDAKKVSAAVLVADGGKAPTVIDSDGATTVLHVSDNVAAAEIPASGKLVTAAGAIDLGDAGKTVPSDCRAGTSCTLR